MSVAPQNPPAPESSGPILPAELAFVIQLRSQDSQAPPRFEGRLEHVVSHAASWFGSEQELIELLRRVLGRASGGGWSR